MDCVDSVCCGVVTKGLFTDQIPTTPKYRDVKERLSTFRDDWKGCVTANELAEAGFYFLQKPDVVRCFHCNGGLQHWEEFENPWYEHAKWYPLCEFLLRKQGVNYVKKVVKQNLKLNRPRVYKESLAMAAQPIRDLLKEDKVKRIDLKAEKNLDHTLKFNKHVNYARSAGVEERRIKHAVSSLLEQNPNFDQLELFDKIFSLPFNLDDMLCPRCRVRERDTILFPCVHLGLCWQCESDSQPSCFVCRSKPNKAVRMYRY